MKCNECMISGSVLENKPSVGTLWITSPELQSMFSIKSYIVNYYSKKAFKMEDKMFTIQDECRVKN